MVAIAVSRLIRATSAVCDRAQSASDCMSKFVKQINIENGGKLKAPACNVSGKGPK